MTVAQTALEPTTRVKIVEPSTLSERLNNLFEQVSHRAYEIFERNGRVFGNDLEDWFKAECEILSPLDLQIKEKKDSLTAEAKVPGFSAEELEISLEPWRLTISGKKETKKEQKNDTTTFKENSEELLGVIDLPSEIDSAKATATLKNGTLIITLPKVATAAAIQSDVKVA